MFLHSSSSGMPTYEDGLYFLVYCYLILFITSQSSTPWWLIVWNISRRSEKTISEPKPWWGYSDVLLFTESSSTWNNLSGKVCEVLNRWQWITNILKVCTSGICCSWVLFIESKFDKIFGGLFIITHLFVTWYNHKYTQVVWYMGIMCLPLFLYFMVLGVLILFLLLWKGWIYKQLNRSVSNFPAQPRPERSERRSYRVSHLPLYYYNSSAL